MRLKVVTTDQIRQPDPDKIRGNSDVTLTSNTKQFYADKLTKLLTSRAF